MSGTSWGSFILDELSMKSEEKCEIGHAHSENNLRVAGELGRDVPPKLRKDRVGRTTLSNDLHTTSIYEFQVRLNTRFRTYLSIEASVVVHIHDTESTGSKAGLRER